VGNVNGVLASLETSIDAFRTGTTPDQRSQVEEILALSLSQIKSAHIGGVARRELGDKE
jgi:hypothetical protein